jgi:hypothetical protein
MALPPLPAIGTARIEILGPLSGSARWGEAIWGQSNWALYGWFDVTPQSMNARITWGADDPEGVLTVPAAGSWLVKTYDPKRLLDPSNGASPLSSSLKPGRAVRVTYHTLEKGTVVVRQGLIDEVEYDLITKQGTLRGTDVVQLMVGAKLPEGMTGAPDTLRERAYWLVQQGGLGTLVKVERTGGANLLTNGDFENGTTGWSSGRSFTPPSTQPPAIGGTKVLEIQGGAGYPKSIQQLNAVPGGVYTLKGWMLLAAGGKQPSALITARNNGSQSGGSPAITGTSPKFEWQPFSTTYTVPLDGSITTVEADLRINSSATATGDFVWFDAVSLEGPTGVADPKVGPLDAREQSVWQHILTAAYDALYACWLDAEGTLRFRSFGNPNDLGLQIGGAAGIPIDTLVTQASLQGVHTRVVTYDMTAPEVPVEAVDIGKTGIYGDIVLHRQLPVPNARAWVDSVLADRSGSGLQYSPGTLRPQTEEQFNALIALGMIDLVNLVVESIDPTINVAARVLGGSIEANTESGWSATLATYIPGSEWEEAEAPPVIPPEPPGGGTVPGQVRTYAATADSRLAHSSSLDAGNGMDVNLPIGYIGPYRNRGVIDFADIPFGDVVSIEKAELLLTVGANSCGAFGADPKVKVERITAKWSEGTYNSNCGFSTSNSVKYPGPAVSSSGAVTKSMPKGSGSAVSIDITAIARAWLGGAAQYGVRLISAGEDTSKYTTSVYTRHHGTAAYRPSIKLTLTKKA